MINWFICSFLLISSAYATPTPQLPTWTSDVSYVPDPHTIKFIPDPSSGDPRTNQVSIRASLVSMWTSRGTKTVAVLGTYEDDDDPDNGFGEISVLSASYYPPYSQYKPYARIASFHPDEAKYNYITYNGYVHSFAHGYDMELVGDDIHAMLFFNVYQETAPHNGGIFYSRGLNSQWSVHQLLTVDTNYDDLDDDGNLFGQSFGVDRLHYRAMVVGSPSYSRSYSEEGALYFFEATDPKVKGWTQQQQLLHKEYTELGVSDTKIYGPTLFSGAVNRLSTWPGILVWSLGPNRKWSAQQFLLNDDAPTQPYSSADIYDDVIAIGYAQATVDGEVKKGVVKIFEASPAIPGPKGRPKRWSVTQTLISPNIDNFDTFFGRKVALTGDDLFVGSSGNTTNTYFFYRVNGKFTVVAMLCSSPELNCEGDHMEAYDAVIVGQDAIVSYSDVDLIYSPDGTIPPMVLGNFTGGAVSVYTKQGPASSKCLRVSLGDHFGDGWDTAMLRIETPFGEVDHVSNECVTLNPNVFRYCPSEDKPGVYKFSIVGAPKSKFPWEIHWKVYLESENRWITGDQATQMDFLWDPSKQQFNLGATKHVLGNATCTKCPPKPGPKPKPKPSPLPDHDHDSNHTQEYNHRQLSTTFPTYVDDNWQYVQLSSPFGDDWFEYDHEGAYFYISDVKGNTLYSSGTMCPGQVSVQCWQTLPDGDYIFRVGGALKANITYNENSFDWSFCHIIGNEMTEMAFEIRNGSCRAKYRITSNSYCTSVLHAFSVMEINLFIEGVTIDDVSQLNEFDVLVVTNAVKAALPSVVDVSINFVSGSTSGTVFSLEVTASVEAAGYTGKDPDSLYEYSISMESTLSSRVHQIWSYLVSNSIEGSTIFRTSKSARLQSTRIEKVFYDNPELASQKEEVFTYQKAEDKFSVPEADVQVEYVEIQESSLLDNEYVRKLSSAGYAMIAVVALVIVVVISVTAAKSVARAVFTKTLTADNTATSIIDHDLSLAERDVSSRRVTHSTKRMRRVFKRKNAPKKVVEVNDIEVPDLEEMPSVDESVTPSQSESDVEPDMMTLEDIESSEKKGEKDIESNDSSSEDEIKPFTKNRSKDSSSSSEDEIKPFVKNRKALVPSTEQIVD